MAAPDETAANRARASSPADDTPVRDDELDALFAPLASFSLIVLAVSGGADSMALMLLVRRWLARHAGRPEVVVATVDHGLRAEARAEGLSVARQALDLGFEATLLTWAEEKPASGIQDAARAARYRLLTEFARTAASGPAAIVTAHTEDDQAETMLMRLARGSGLDGLVGMPASRAADDALPQVALVRPLLGISGARLRATLQAAGRTWIEDPSNDADQFERVRVRKARAALEGLGITNDKLALSGRRLARAKAALDAAVDALQRAAKLDVHGGAYASLETSVWLAAPEELRLRLLGRLITAFGGQTEPLRLAQLETLIERMSGDHFDGATLAGTIIARSGDLICVQREPGRLPLPTLTLTPGASAVWDHRFRVTSAHAAPGPVEVRALGGAAYARLRQQLDGAPAFPARAAATLPAFWREAELLYVPQLVNLPSARAFWTAERELYSAEFIA